jgi:hypothetical protein
MEQRYSAICPMRAFRPVSHTGNASCSEASEAHWQTADTLAKVRQLKLA